MASDAFSILVNLLLFMFGLVILGEPLRVLISRISGLFNRLDIVQILVINVYLGGFILYIIALIPLHLFRPNVLWGVLLFSTFFTIVYYLKKLFSEKKIQIRRNEIFIYLITFLIFLIVLWIGIIPTTNFIFGNVHDSSLFSLFAKVIVDNHQIVETLDPYVSEGIIYPQGFFTIIASAHVFLGMHLAEIPLRITPLFQALSVLGAYYLGKDLSGKKLGLSLAFILAFVSRWPRLLVWGSNAFVAGFPLYFVCLGLIPSVLKSRSEKSNATKLTTLLVAGLLFGYLAAIHLTLCEVLIFTLFGGGVVHVLRSDDKKNATYLISRKLLYFLIATLIPISVFVYRAIKWYHYPGHNLGLPSDFVAPPLSIFNAIKWAFISEGISPYPLLRVEIVVLIISAVVIIYVSKKRLKINKMRNIIKIILVSIAGAIFQFFLSMLESTFPSLNLYAGEPAKPTVLIFVSLLMLIGVFNVILWHDFSDFIGIKRFRNPINKRSLLARSGLIIVVVQIFLLIYTPFFYYTYSSDLEYLNGQYYMFCVTTWDDVELMQWMTDGIPDDSKVLINPYESGSFIPLLSDVRSIVYPFTARRHSGSYQTLINLICQQTLNATTYQLIKNFGVDYVFVGSRALSGRPGWDATLFLGNPNFKTTKNIGNSYLFKILSTDPTLIFSDDFEYENLTERDWIYHVAKECIGNGTGQAVISSQYAKYGTSSLMITARKTRGWYYANWIYRKVWLPRTANTTLSFYIDANCSSSYDFMAIIISDESWENKVYLTTPNHHPSEYMIKLLAPQGSFTFNLSQIWLEKFNSTLPNSIYLEIQITDFDGIIDVGFIDYITIRV